MRTFASDDAGYIAWLAQHPTGWVINAKRNPSASYVKLHRADCATISELQHGYSRWTTGEYIKICAEHRPELERWARSHLGCSVQDGCHCLQSGTTPQQRCYRAGIGTSLGHVT